MGTAFRSLLPHEALLVGLLRRSATRDVLPHHLQLLNDPEGRAGFLRDAGHHEVLGLALTALARTSEFLRVLSPAATTALLAPLSTLRRQAAFWDLERGRVLHRLRSAGVDPVVLKGGALRMTTYSESIERPIADLDLLIREHEMQSAVEALESVRYAHAYGDLRALYRAHHFHFIMKHPGGFTVELHWALTPPSAPVRLDNETIRERAVRLGAPHAVRVPSPEDMVLHLMCQNIGDGFAKLRRTVDIDRILSRSADFDWTYLGNAAERADALTAAALTLQLSNRLLDTPLPDHNVADLFGVPLIVRAGIASVHPVCLHVRRLDRGDESRRDLLRLWTARGSKSWLWALGRRLYADHYRFWIIGTARKPPTLLRRTFVVGKLLFLQTSSYITAAVRLLTHRGRESLQFWTS